MKFVGIDLHKKSISICVVNQERKVVIRKRFGCAAPERIVSFFKELELFQAVMEATSSYEWLFKLLDPLAERVLLAHPKKLQLDAEVLAEFLALGMIPEAHRATPRQRQHRRLVRQRVYLHKRITCVRSKIRWILTDYNADRSDLFTSGGLKYLKQVKVAPEDRFVLDQLTEE